MMKGFFGSTGGSLSKQDGESGFAAAVEVETYWQALRDQNHIPHRRDLDPRGIRGSLSKAFVLECNEGDQPRFRIVGSDLCDLQKTDLRGLPVTTLIPLHKRPMMEEMIMDVVRLPAHAQLDFMSKTAEGETYDLRMVLMPMNDDQGRCTRILGCLDFETQLLSKRRRLDLKMTGSIIRPLGTERQAIVRRMHHRGLKLVTSSTTVRSRARRPRSVPYLTLVTS